MEDDVEGDRTTGARRRRYACVGTGHRAEMYLGALLGSHRDVGVPVALCDVNRTRMAYYQRMAADRAPDLHLPAYGVHEYDAMLAAVRPDCVLVTSVDSTHADYIARALRAGCDVISEKPLTTDAAGCRQVVEAVEQSGRDLVVAFNYRYSPRNSAVKQLVADGAVGEVTSVVLEWVLDTAHGADYFRRWHRDKSRSGGLLVHKASHHFDLVTWWLDDVPETVFASGGLRFYGDANARARGLGDRPLRSHGAAGSDPFGLDLSADERLRALYLDAEAEDGYLRDRDVFSPGVTIEDNLGVLVTYARGTVLTYALNAHAPWEGYRVAVNGTAGRLELSVVERGALPRTGGGTVIGGFGTAVDPSAASAGDGTGSDDVRPRGTTLVLQRHWEPAQVVPVAEGDGAHGGGDAKLLDDLFRPDPAPDPLGRRAGHLDGVRSVLVGAGANRALETGQPTRLADLGVPLPSSTPPRRPAAPARSVR